MSCDDDFVQARRSYVARASRNSSMSEVHNHRRPVMADAPEAHNKISAERTEKVNLSQSPLSRRGGTKPERYAKGPVRLQIHESEK